MINVLTLHNSNSEFKSFDEYLASNSTIKLLVQKHDLGHMADVYPTIMGKVLIEEKTENPKLNETTHAIFVSCNYAHLAEQDLSNYDLETGQKRFYLLETRINVKSQTYAFKKGSPFTRTFNSIFQRIFESGIDLYLYELHHFVYQIRLGILMEKAGLREDGSIETNNIILLLIVLCCGYSLATLVFLLELYFGRKHRRAMYFYQKTLERFGDSMFIVRYMADKRRYSFSNVRQIEYFEFGRRASI
jgi:hypothetical protein